VISVYRSPKPSARPKTIRWVPGTAGFESCVQNAGRPVLHPPKRLCGSLGFAANV